MAAIDLISDIQCKIHIMTWCAQSTILIVMLEQMSVTGVTLKLFKSYLANKQHYVSINNINRCLKIVICIYCWSGINWLFYTNSLSELPLNFKLLVSHKITVGKYQIFYMKKILIIIFPSYLRISDFKTRLLLNILG